MSAAEDRIRQLLDEANLPWETLLDCVEEAPLPAERRAAVERALAAAPELARFVEGARADRDALAQLLDEAEAQAPPGAFADALAQWERQQLIGEAPSSGAWRMVRRLALAAGLGLLATVAVVAGRRALGPAAQQAPLALQEQPPFGQQSAPGALADAAGTVAAEAVGRSAPPLRARSAANRSGFGSGFEGAFPVAAPLRAGAESEAFQTVSQASRLVRALRDAEQALPYARQGRLALLVESQRPADLLVSLTELSGASEEQTRFHPNQRAFAYAVSEAQASSSAAAQTPLGVPLGVLTLPADRAALATALLLARETGRARFVALDRPLALPQSAWRTDQAWWRGATSQWRPLAAVEVRLAPASSASPEFSPGARPALGEPLRP